MFEILFSLVVILIVYYNCYKFWTHWRYTAKFPGPIAFPLIGNAIQLGLNPTEHVINVTKWYKFYDNKIFRLYFGVTPYFALSNPKDVEVILSSATILKKPDFYEFLEPWLGQGLVTSHGSKWHKHRKMITPSFHFSILQDFSEIMIKCSRTFITKLIEKEKSSDIFDIQSMIHCLTFDIICETAMGVELNSLDDPNKEVIRAYNEICYTMQNRFFSVLKRSKFLYLFYPECHRQRKAIKYLKSFMDDIIQKRREILTNSLKLNNNTGNGNDMEGKRKRAFLDKLLMETIDNVPLTNDEIAGEVSTFAFAGHDTTSSGISFAVLLLSRHPNVQEKVLKEQYEIYGNDTSRDPTYQEIQSMKYLDMVIKEAQRIFPSVPNIARKAEREININGQKIPKGSGIFIGIMSMGLNGKIFKDPLKFDPERFNSERAKTNPYEYIPFSAGPRNCLGQKFAMLEMKTTLSMMVRNFEILPPDDSLISSGNYVRELEYLYDSSIRKHPYDPILTYLITLQSVNGIFIRIRRRQHF